MTEEKKVVCAERVPDGRPMFVSHYDGLPCGKPPAPLCAEHLAEKLAAAEKRAADAEQRLETERARFALFARDYRESEVLRARLLVDGEVAQRNGPQETWRDVLAARHG